ncbi:MAG: hypothetical protein AAF959_28800 [Cyanobacteria bacterium P01_D01_bin.56]
MKPKAFVAISTGSLLLLMSCSSPANLEQETDVPTQESTTSAPESTEETAQEDAASPSSNGITSDTQTTASTINVEIANNRMGMDRTEADTGLVSFNIRNDSKKRMRVFLLRTDLPGDQIPFQDDNNIDIEDPAVKRVGRPETNPLPVGESSVLARKLRPGNYVLIAYAPKRIADAVTQEITIHASKP